MMILLIKLLLMLMIMRIPAPATLVDPIQSTGLSKAVACAFAFLITLGTHSRVAGQNAFLIPTVPGIVHAELNIAMIPVLEPVD
jgi:hypothetical protein